MLSSQVDREEPLYIYGPPPLAEYIETSRRLLDMYLNYEIVVREVTEPGVLIEDPEFRVRCFPLRHSKPCWGYTMEENDRPGEFHPEKAMELGLRPGPLYARLQAGEDVQAPDGTIIRSADVVGAPRKGRKFSFVTDTLAVPAISREVEGSDLFICEGMFARAEELDAIDKRHMTAEHAAGLAKAANVKKLALIHYSPRYTDYELKGILKEAQAVFPDTLLSHDRMVIPVEYEE
jgi:ribonuclease Z